MKFDSGDPRLYEALTARLRSKLGVPGLLEKVRGAGYRVVTQDA
ncbi:hypothetical protein [Streptomyces sp. NPDC047525]